MTSGPFIAELPYAHFKFILTDPFDGGRFRCELAAGSFSFNGMVIKSPQILVQAGAVGPAAAQVALQQRPR